VWLAINPWNKVCSARLNAGLQQIADFHISDHMMEVQAMVSVRSFAIGAATVGAALFGINTGVWLLQR
jgi:hypothetical protein